MTLPPGYGLLTLDQLIGNMDHLIVTSGTIDMQGGLFTRWWKFIHPSKKAATSLPLCGCGASSFVEDPAKDAPWLLTISFYVNELEKLIDTLQLSEYNVYGSSWGTVVAQEFSVRQPVGLKHLILDGVVGDGQLHVKTLWRDVISTMPTYTRNLLKDLEERKAFGSPEYQALVDTLTKHFTCRIVPTPDVFMDCFRSDGPGENKGMNQKIYVAMQGPSEFGLSGVLEFYSVLDRLPRVLVPTLVLRGEFDTMSEEASMAVVNAISSCLPLVTVKGASHCKVLDEPQICCNIIFEFLEQ
ncbi:hypothetical protein HDU82_003737 [Entophlyctis luteolus]|nr:hypothetical protein HDU82_003737 [Entophlyctis luteolus]